MKDHKSLIEGDADFTYKESKKRDLMNFALNF